MVKTCLIIFLAIFCISGCKQKAAEEAPHVKEQRERDRKRAEAREAKIKAAKAGKAPVEEDDGHDHHGHGHGSQEEPRKPSTEDFEEDKWPAAVLEGYKWAFKASIAEMPEASRQLARLGLPAVKAMRRIIAHHRLPVKKRAFMAMMMVQLHMFRVADLSKFLQDKEMPFVQRSSIEALAMLGTTEAVDALKVMRATLEKGGLEEQKKLQEKNPRAPNPYGPLIGFIDQALTQARPLGMSAAQLKALDTVYQSKTAAELKEAIKGISDMTYEPGMVMIMASPVSSELVKVGAALKLIEMARKEKGKVLGYARPQFPPMLRMAAARFIVERGDKAEVEQLAKIASEQRDPLSPALQDILINKPVVPKAPKL